MRSEYRLTHIGVVKFTSEKERVGQLHTKKFPILTFTVCHSNTSNRSDQKKMGTQKKKKNTVAKKVVDNKSPPPSTSRASGVAIHERLPPGTECAQHIRSILNRDAERLESLTRPMPDHVLIELTSDVLKNPDMYPAVVSEADKIAMGPVDRAVLRVRRELFITNACRDVQQFLGALDVDESFRKLASKAVGLAAFLAEGMRGSFSFANWFVEMMLKTQAASKEDITSLSFTNRVRLVAIGMYMFIRATHEVYGKECLYFPGNLGLTLRYVYGMFYSHTGTILRNGHVYCMTACLLALGTFGSPDIHTALDEICIPHHERCCATTN